MTAKLTRREALTLLAAGTLASSAFGLPHKPSSMHTKRLPSPTGVIPVIGLGTWQTFDVGESSAARENLEKVLTLFVELGGQVIDSSPMYGTSEEVFGAVAEESGLRDLLFVATKVWTTGRAAGIRQMEASERKTRGQIDLMQVHNLVDVDTHLETLREWKAKRRIRFIGITHYTSSAYGEVEKVLRRHRDVDFLQINYSLAEREAERRLLPLAKELGVGVLINRPFGAGSLFRQTRNKPLPAFAKDLGSTSWAELFLKFVVSHPAVTCAIPATSNVEHLRQNMRAGLGLMPDEKMRQRIVAAASG
ncbi:MAG TPA: aldo/keto reductase [Thermoanaerobaculia bacterium]